MINNEIILLDEWRDLAIMYGMDSDVAKEKFIQYVQALENNKSNFKSR